MSRTLLIGLVRTVQGRCLCIHIHRSSRNQRQNMYLQLYSHRKKCVPPERQAGWDESLSSVEDSFVLIKFRVTINEVINTTAPDVYKGKSKMETIPLPCMGHGQMKGLHAETMEITAVWTKSSVDK